MAETEHIVFGEHFVTDRQRNEANKAAAEKPPVPPTAVPQGGFVFPQGPQVGAQGAGMKYTDSQHRLLAQVSSGCHGGMNAKCNQALEADLGPSATATILNQAGPGSAAGSFYDPQQVKVAGLMGEGTAATFAAPIHPPYTVDEANKQVEKWAKQGEKVTATPEWVGTLGAFLTTFGPVPLT